jgi:hypothetical protein
MWDRQSNQDNMPVKHSRRDIILHLLTESGPMSGRAMESIYHRKIEPLDRHDEYIQIESDGAVLYESDAHEFLGDVKDLLADGLIEVEEYDYGDHPYKCLRNFGKRYFFIITESGNIFATSRQ